MKTNEKTPTAPELLAMVKALADELRKREQWCARDIGLCRKCGKEDTCLILKADLLAARAKAPVDGGGPDGRRRRPYATEELAGVVGKVVELFPNVGRVNHPVGPLGYVKYALVSAVIDDGFRQDVVLDGTSYPQLELMRIGALVDGHPWGVAET